MPIYEYACTSCEHAFDELQKVSEAALVNCPACGKPSLRKLLSAPKFRLAGKGWYETDFKTGKKRNLAGDSETSSKPKDTAPTGGDSKPPADKSTASAAKSTPDSKASTP